MKCKYCGGTMILDTTLGNEKVYYCPDCNAELVETTSYKWIEGEVSLDE